MKLRVLIADDEEYCRQKLTSFLAGETDVEIVGACRSGLETLNAIQQLIPDLVFLDIRMPELDAFAILEQLDPNRLPVIVLVSAFDEFAVRAFDSEAVDYLLKPFDRERFDRAFRRALKRVSHEAASHNAAQVKELLEVVRAREKQIRRFTVKTGGRYILINPEDVDWISSADNYSELHVGKTTHLLRSSLTALAEQLAQRHFVQINRSTLVNQERVRQIARKSHGDARITLSSGEVLVATRTFRAHWKLLLHAAR